MGGESGQSLRVAITRRLEQVLCALALLFEIQPEIRPDCRIGHDVSAQPFPRTWMLRPSVAIL
jgi:hypothetical protein